MKTSKYIYSFMLAVALAFAGCSDFLDSEDNSNIAGDNFYQTEDDFRAATAPLYNKVWFDFNDKFYYGLGDGRGFNLCATTSNYIYPFDRNRIDGAVSFGLGLIIQYSTAN